MASTISKYFKRELKTYKIFVQVNPENFTGIELIQHPDGKIEKTELEFDAEIFEDLEEDSFKSCSALEFQLLLSRVK